MPDMNEILGCDQPSLSAFARFPTTEGDTIQHKALPSIRQSVPEAKTTRLMKLNETSANTRFVGGNGESRMRLDVLKALADIDHRLELVDRVSMRLEEDHKQTKEVSSIAHAKNIVCL